jgi:predicted nucleotidyltransferase
LAQQTRADLQPIVDVLVRQFGAIRIILFGSLARGRFAPDSDIDLAVEGIAPEHYFAALAAINRLTRRWVDLKPLEDLDPHFRQRVLTTGECIYARDVG